MYVLVLNIIPPIHTFPHFLSTYLKEPYYCPRLLPDENGLNRIHIFYI